MDRDVTINIDWATIKKYWLSISAAAVGIWTSLNPAAQASIIHQVSVFIHGYPALAKFISFAAVIALDLKQSPLAATQPPPAK